jgi:hypothetical protein
MKHTQTQYSKDQLRRTAWGEQAECNNEAFKKGMTSTDANFVGRSTQEGL